MKHYGSDHHHHQYKKHHEQQYTTTNIFPNNRNLLIVHLVCGTMNSYNDVPHPPKNWMEL